MAIGNADFTARQKKGFKYFFNLADNEWATIEPPMLLWLQGKGLEWKNEETANDAQFKADLQAVINDLKDDPTQMPAVKAVLELP